jgi:hypothetical protein
MDKATLKKKKEYINSLEKELKDLHKKYDLLFKNMHKYSKQEYEELGDLLARNISETTGKYKAACDDLLFELSRLQSD